MYKPACLLIFSLIATIACSKVTPTPPPVPRMPTPGLIDVTMTQQTEQPQQNRDMMSVADGIATNRDNVFINVRDCRNNLGNPLFCDLARSEDHTLLSKKLYANQTGNLYIQPLAEISFEAIYESSDGSLWLMIRDSLFVIWCDSKEWMSVTFNGREQHCTQE
jgi:hypothetical protein